MNEINNAGKAMTSTMQRQKFRGKNNPVQAKMTHTHERIYPIHIVTKVFFKYNLTLTFHFQYTLQMFTGVYRVI